MTQAGVERVARRVKALGNPLRREIVSFQHRLALKKAQMSGEVQHLCKYFGTLEVHTEATLPYNQMIEVVVVARRSTSPSTSRRSSQMSASITS